MTSSNALRVPVLIMLFCCLTAPGYGQAVKRIPAAGVPVPEADRAMLEAGSMTLGKQIEELRVRYKANAGILDLLPDVQIYHNAVRYALTYDEFFAPRDITSAKKLLTEGQERANLLAEGKSPWTTATGLLVRGYVSKIDGSVQPYGIIVPPSFAADPSRKRRLDLWYHGRGETLSEVSFLSDRERSVGEFAPSPDSFMLHPYGRYCNANRFAGEVDTLEAIDHAKKHYAIDDNRILVRGFSMGGASTWMFATHYSSMWAAAAPGAGFSETSGFLNLRDLNQVPWYEQKLWHLYDSVDYALNLSNLPTVAYSGELDGQKQAADMMAKALSKVGIEMVHVIGAGAHHNYVPAAKAEINRRLDSIAEHGRIPIPSHVKFTTWTLKYNQMFWVSVDALGHHWEQANIEAQIVDSNTVQITSSNVTGLTLTMPPGYCPLDDTGRPKVKIDGLEIIAAPVMSDRSWTAHFSKTDDKWSAIDTLDDSRLRKRPGLQGPIDDAFMDSFVFVKPTGKGFYENTSAWAAGEMTHAIEHWRRQFRGEARVKEDSAITDADIASSNLVLFGDPSSNKVLAKIFDKLAIHWDATSVHVGDKTYPADKNVAVMIYPNPLNPKKYIVLNSGFTFREFDYLNNARQTPKLPDWAIVDTSIPANARTPGGITAAGFFGEQWEVKPGIE